VGRLHGRQREDLEQVVLHHVAESARLLVVARTGTDALFLGHRDLNVVHVPLVHQRLENAVRKPQHQDVLDRFLSEIVIDSIDLLLVEYLGDGVVDRAGALEIAADRLLDDDARERLVAL